MLDFLKMSDVELEAAIKRSNKRLDYLAEAWNDSSSKEFSFYKSTLEDWAKVYGVELTDDLVLKKLSEDVDAEFHLSDELLKEQNSRV